MMIKGIRKNNFYYLKSKLIGAISTISTKGEDLEATRLWHIYLRHIGGKFFHNLIHQCLLKGAKARKLNFCKH